MLLVNVALSCEIRWDTRCVMDDPCAAAACLGLRAERRLVKLSIALIKSSMLVGSDMDVILVDE